ncbi:hypothetical protein [Thauera linaloolentis]|nr:hypothetical protein [Thauera linaloolentis]
MKATAPAVALSALFLPASGFALELPSPDELEIARCRLAGS